MVTTTIEKVQAALIHIHATLAHPLPRYHLIVKTSVMRMSMMKGALIHIHGNRGVAATCPERGGSPVGARPRGEWRERGGEGRETSQP